MGTWLLKHFFPLSDLIKSSHSLSEKTFPREAFTMSAENARYYIIPFSRV